MPVLNTADKIYLGNQVASAVYAGGNKVWPAKTAPPLPVTSGLAIWYDAVGLAPITTQWPDKSGMGNHGLIGGGTPPVVVPNVLNGWPVVQFDATQGRLRINNSTGVTTNWTLVYVARIIGPKAGRIVSGTYLLGLYNANILFGFWNGFEDVMYDNGFGSPNTQTPWLGAWKLYSADGIPTLDRFFGNGNLLGTNSTPMGWMGSFAISGFDPGFGSASDEPCDCQVAEVVLYNRRLSGAERQSVEGYLRSKWGL